MFSLYLDGEVKHGTTTRSITQEKKTYKLLNRNTIVWHLEKLKRENIYTPLKNLAEEAAAKGEVASLFGSSINLENLSKEIIPLLPKVVTDKKAGKKQKAEDILIQHVSFSADANDGFGKHDCGCDEDIDEDCDTIPEFGKHYDSNSDSDKDDNSTVDLNPIKEDDDCDLEDSFWHDHDEDICTWEESWFLSDALICTDEEGAPMRVKKGHRNVIENTRAIMNVCKHK